MSARVWLDKLRSEPRGWARLVSAGLRLLIAGFFWHGVFVLIREGDRNWLVAGFLQAVAGTVFLLLGLRTLLRAIREILAGEPALSPRPFQSPSRPPLP
ncbi:MAG: hypothetical protein HY736_05920 [Verrucomicrobia bacterium]|nr:hypothetical protein [Verrucomicrobiota bacterium]